MKKRGASMGWTFDGLNIARSGVQAARVGLNVTGQNISNAQTPGYTRQRLDQTAIPPSVMSLLSSGQGVQMNGISQMRDPFLDGQYRLESAMAGETTTQLDSLSNLENIFNITSKSSSSDSTSTSTNALAAEFSDLVSQLQGLTTSGSSATESTVKEEASLLATKLNTIAKQIDAEWSQQKENLDQYGVSAANDLMKNIASLNDQIKKAQVAGQSALELQDERNGLIDQLSQYANIKVVETPTDVGAGRKVDTLSIYLADDNGQVLSGYKDSPLVDGNDYSSFSLTTVSRGKDAGEIDSDTENPYDAVILSLNNIDGSVQALNQVDNNEVPGGAFSGYLKLLNESGDFDRDDASSSATTSQGIGYYRQLLDRVAQTFADVMNKANSTNDAGDNKPLFTAQMADGSESTSIGSINAENIRISSSWTSGYLTMSKDTPNSGDNTSNSYSNITYMISALTNSNVTLKSTEIGETGGINVYTGSIQNAVTNIATTLGQNIKSTDSLNTTNVDKMDEIDNERAAVSSVDTNEEATNLIIFNQALTASARFMTAVDECLQTIISEMGTAGRG